MFEARLGAGIGHAVSLPALMLVGLFVGYIAGMFGMGGGFLLTPTLMYLFGVPAPMAVGSALCQTCGTSLASFLKYRRLKRGEPRIDLVMLGGSLIGVDAGTRTLAHLQGLGMWEIRGGHAVPVVQLVLDILFLLLLLYGFGLSARNAAGTGILLLLCTVILGTLEQALHGNVSLKLAMVILIGSSIGTQLGALTTHYLPNRYLRLILLLLIFG